MGWIFREKRRRLSTNQKRASHVDYLRDVKPPVSRRRVALVAARACMRAGGMLSEEPARMSVDTLLNITIVELLRRHTLSDVHSSRAKVPCTINRTVES